MRSQRIRKTPGLDRAMRSDILQAISSLQSGVEHLVRGDRKDAIAQIDLARAFLERLRGGRSTCRGCSEEYEK